MVSSLTVTPDVIGIAARCGPSSAPCPRCGTRADRVHSRYLRTIADQPCQGRFVVLRLTVRRFRCAAADGPRLLFAERLPGVVRPYARATVPLTAAHRALGLALGGEAGARLADALGLPTSPDTILRRVTATAAAPGW